MPNNPSQVIPSGSAVDRIGVKDQPADNPYLRDAVLTASPEQLQLMLYDGCIRFTIQARDAIEKKDYETSYERLSRAQHIVLEMINGLNHDVNKELCDRMASIYNFLYRKLVDACIKRDVDAIDDALRILRIERDTWRILVEKVTKTRAVSAEEVHGQPSLQPDPMTSPKYSTEESPRVSFSA